MNTVNMRPKLVITCWVGRASKRAGTVAEKCQTVAL